MNNQRPYRPLTPADVRQVRADTDALEGIAGQRIDGHTWLCDGGARAAHRALRLVPPTGAPVGLVRHRQGQLDAALMVGILSGRRKLSVECAALLNRSTELFIDLYRMLEERCARGVSSAPLAWVSEAASPPARAAEAVEMRATGSTLHVIDRDLHLGGSGGTDLAIRAGLAARIAPLAEGCRAPVIDALWVAQCTVWQQLCRRSLPSLPAARMVIRLLRVQAELEGLVHPPRPGSRR